MTAPNDVIRLCFGFVFVSDRPFFFLKHSILSQRSDTVHGIHWPNAQNDKKNSKRIMSKKQLPSCQVQWMILNILLLINRTVYCSFVLRTLNPTSTSHRIPFHSIPYHTIPSSSFSFYLAYFIHNQFLNLASIQYFHFEYA